ncbi:MAG: hypothetical protein IJ766_00940 [Clostridia bacterium]|nr:hypothetical protein [Clostridia bacterium]
MSKIIAFFMAIIMFLIPSANIPKQSLDTDKAKTEYAYVFVNGFGGWGEFDFQNKLLSYWGMVSGDMMKYLRARGVDAHAASVDPYASAWDRACELYAQLTGTRVDYGAEHSERCGHDRFGKDYSGKALVSNWSAENKVNLIGHSFGGPTILMLLRLMATGSDAEQAATSAEEISGLFTGGKGDWFYSLTSVAGALNGTTAVNAKEDIEDGKDTKAMEKLGVKVVGKLSDMSDRADFDCALYDMLLDNALELSDSFEVLENVYYFSIPCSYTTQNSNGTWSPIRKGMTPFFHFISERMGKYTDVTPKGFVVDESWQENDGMVNTKSERAPLNAPQQDLNKDNIQPGIWNVFPTYKGDHLSLTGGIISANTEMREVYMDLINMINAL